MAIDTFIVYAAVYGDVDDAEADYELVKDLHTKADLIDAYDAAVIERRRDGKVKIVRKHETPTRVGGVLGAGLVAAGFGIGMLVARTNRQLAARGQLALEQALDTLEGGEEPAASVLGGLLNAAMRELR